jgi:hypothetical protein
MSLSDREPPKGPSPIWLVPTVLGTLGALVLSQWVDFPALLQKKLDVSEVLVHTLFALAVVVALRGLVGAPRWLRLRGISKRYPYEPWRWEFPQGRELMDEQVAKAAEAVAAIVLLTPLVLGLTGLGAWVLLAGEVPILGALFLVGVWGSMVWVMIQRAIIPSITRLLAFMRYGQTRLRLQQFPLVPDSKTQVRLTMPRGLGNLDHVRGVVRRVRERVVEEGYNKHTKKRGSNSSTVQDVEVIQPQFIKAEEGRNGNTLSFTLTVPPARGPEDTTNLSSGLKCFWELNLTSDVPGLDLDITFKLPVYWVDEGQSSAA